MAQRVFCRAITEDFKELASERVPSRVAAEAWKTKMLSAYPEAVITMIDIDEDGVAIPETMPGAP